MHSSIIGDCTASQAAHQQSATTAAVLLSDDSDAHVQPRPQARPVIPMPSQNQLVMPGQAQPSRMRPAGHMTNGYTPSVQQMERDYPVAAQPVRQPYPDAVSAVLMPWKDGILTQSVGTVRANPVCKAV